VRPVAEIEASFRMRRGFAQQDLAGIQPDPGKRSPKLYVASSAILNRIRILSSFDTKWYGRC